MFKVPTISPSVESNSHGPAPCFLCRVYVCVCLSFVPLSLSLPPFLHLSVSLSLPPHPLDLPQAAAKSRVLPAHRRYGFRGGGVAAVITMTVPKQPV